jgi:hypothetical protein
MKRIFAGIFLAALFGAGVMVGARWLPGPWVAGAARFVKESIETNRHTADPRVHPNPRKVPFYRHPMNAKITAQAMDDMGMDYIPVYEDDGGEETGWGQDPELVHNPGAHRPAYARPYRHIETVGCIDHENRISHAPAHGGLDRALKVRCWSAGAPGRPAVRAVFPA